MDKSTSQGHVNLIREMARETSRSSRSSRHSQGSPSPQPTLSDFDPENEAIMSTRQLDKNVPLPALRASAQKYNRFSRPSRPDPPAQSEPDYAINTSAIGRAFPNFSQGGTSSDDGSTSIEIGRGAKKANSGPIAKLGRPKEYSSNAQLDLDEDSLDFAAPAVGDYVITGTPPLRHRQPSTKFVENARGSMKSDGQTRRPSGLRQQTIETSPPPAKTKDYGSGESGRGSGDHGRTLAAIHARVKDEIDTSHINEDRPPTIDLTVRNTRFGTTKSHQTPLAGKALPTKFNSTQGLMTTSISGRKNRSHKIATPNQGTQQSFLLPDMPNMSELVSGVFEDGTPVFSRNGKSRPSRFAKVPGYADVDEIPIPEDEHAIFLSLKLLQDKIAVLEKNDAEKGEIIHDLERKNQALESERIQQRRASRRNDSALGFSESDGEGRKLTIENNRLESSVRALQTQLDASNRKATTAETILRTITQERDSAVSQLSVAYVTIKQLQADNEDLRQENELLRGPTHHLPEGDRETTMKKTRKSTGNSGGQKPVTQALNLPNPPNKATRFAKHSSRHTSAPKANSTADVDMFDLTPRPQVTTTVSRKTAQRGHEGASGESEGSFFEAPQERGKGVLAANPASLRYGRAQDEESTRDLTYLSFLDSNEVAKLRRTLEQERIERKQRQPIKRQPSKGEAFTSQEAQITEQTQRSEGPLPKKSLMKDLTSRSLKENEQQDASLHAKSTSGHDRRHSETSILSMRSRRRGMNADNMTSAFIVPDITIRATAIAAQEVPKLSKENKVVLEELANHNGENCTVCKRNPTHNGPHSHTVTISKPVPVSERMPTTGPYEEEPTARPSQAPGLALATVIKGLEDEIAHLKIELAEYQALYNGYDPALSKRKRKSVYETMENLLQAIDVKSDQIYALYDVLEGQKQDGHEISEKEVEITLQSVGIDTAGLHVRGGGAKEDGEPKGKTTKRHPWDLSSEDEGDNELPWEGIESTVETTKSGFTRGNRRRSTAA